MLYLCVFNRGVPLVSPLPPTLQGVPAPRKPSELRRLGQEAAEAVPGPQAQLAELRRRDEK